jgi:hypothetical protein
MIDGIYLSLEIKFAAVRLTAAGLTPLQPVRWFDIAVIWALVDNKKTVAMSC